MNCSFERDPHDPRIVRCTRDDCFNVMVVRADQPLERCHATCKSGDAEAIARHEAHVARRHAPKRNTALHPCIYQGGPTGESVYCGGCGGGQRELFACDIYGSCLPMNVTDGIHSCITCPEYATE